jgi:hypothetical protein
MTLHLVNGTVYPDRIASRPERSAVEGSAVLF